VLYLFVQEATSASYFVDLKDILNL